MSPLEKDLQPGEPWRFDSEVAERFDEMLERSIPTYHSMRDLVLRVATPSLANVAPDVLDLGCSTGETIADVRHAFPMAECVGVDASEAMVAAANRRFDGVPGIHVFRDDLRRGCPAGPWDVIFAVLTIAFIPVEHRQRVLRGAARSLRPDGCFVMVEKTLGTSGRGNDLITAVYHEAKRDAGYTDEEVRRKALSLEGVLVPLSDQMNVAMLRDAGFKVVEPFWRWGPFVGWVCLT